MNSKYSVEYIRAIVDQKGPLYQFQNKYPGAIKSSDEFINLDDAQLAIEQTLNYLESYISKRPELKLTDKYLLNLFFQSFWQKIGKMYKIKLRKLRASRINRIESEILGGQPNLSEESELDELRLRIRLAEELSIEIFKEKCEAKINASTDQLKVLNDLKSTSPNSYLSILTCLTGPNPDRNFLILMCQNMDFEFYILIDELNQRLTKETLYGIADQIRDVQDISEIAKLRKVTTAQLLAQINRFS